MRKIKKIFLLIFLFKTLLSFSQDILIGKNDSWYYYDKGDLDNGWEKTTTFSHWKKGKAPLGYGDKNLLTKISFGENENLKDITKFFKKKIFIKNEYLAYEFRIRRDDGAVVYINGKELFKDNMPFFKVTSNTLAASTSQGKDEDSYKYHYFDNSILKKGENIISVSIHQAYKKSSDCIFSLELIGHNDSRMLPLVINYKKESNVENKISDLNEKFEKEKTLLQKENLESINYGLKILILLISTLFILSILGGYLIIQNFRSKNKQLNRKLTDLTTNSLKKDKEMITLSTNLLHNRQYFKEIKADLKSINTENNKTFKTIFTQIDYVLDRDDDWEILKEHFNAVYNNFYDNLIAKHPSITETELRHCLFIKLHMQTKEIARILLIDPRSVQTTRYRIKKKMKLPENINLRDYLLNLD